MNPTAGGNVDLIYSGALNEGLGLTYRGDGRFTIFSSDEKAVMIAEKYGLGVYMITDKEELEIVNIAMAEVNKQIFNFVGL
jgi:hypothetical protein